MLAYGELFGLAVKYRADGIKDGTSSIELISNVYGRQADLRLWLAGKLTYGEGKLTYVVDREVNLR